MDNLNLTVIAAMVGFVVSSTGLLLVLLSSPRRDCFYFRWSPERRIVALVCAPTLIVLWPIVLYYSLLRSRGIEPADMDV